MMNESKRFEVLFYGDVINCVKDETGKEYNLQELIDILMKQQATIQRMKHSLNTIYKAFEKHYGYDMRNAVWLIDELSYDEIVDELHIAETDSKNRKEASMYWKKKCDEQQATINEQKEAIEYLKTVIRYTIPNQMVADVFKEIGEEYE